MPMMVSADVFADYEGTSKTNAYHTDPNVNSRRTDHFLMRFGPKSREGFMVEQMFQGQLQFLENVYDTWQILGLRPTGGIDPNTKYKTIVQPRQTWDGDTPGTAVGFMEGPQIPGIHIPCNSLGYKAPNGCTPHEVGHGWQNQHIDATTGGLPMMQPPGLTESLANWIMQQQLAGYPQDWIAVGFPYGHAAMSYNCMSIFNYFMEAPGYGAEFINKLVLDPNITTGDGDDFIRKAIRVDTSGAVDKAGAIHDGLGKMNAKMLDMDFWNHRVNHVYSYDQDTTWEGYQFNRIPMVRQPGVDGTWYRPEWTCIPQMLSNNYIPLTITSTASPRTVTCDFRPVADAVRGSSFRACFVAFNKNKEPRYSKVWNVGENSFTLADDENAVYLAVIACPKSLNYALLHSDYTTNNVAMFPYRISLTGATPKGWQWAAPASGTYRIQANGGGKVANTATVDASVYVGPNAMVLGTAKVYGNSRIEDYAVVDSNATIGRLGQADSPVISGHAYVTGNAQVYGHAKVRDYAWVWGSSKVYDNAIVMAHTMLNGASVFGSAVMTQSPLRSTGLSYSGNISGCAIIGGDTSGGSTYTKGIYIEFPGMSVADNQYQYLGYNFEKKSSIFAMDQYGLNHGYLMAEPQVRGDSIGGTTTNVLEFNGTSQYVELKPDAVDFADVTVATWVKWTGTTNDQRVFSTGDGSTKYMYLTPQDSTTGKLRFVISNGTATQYLDGNAALAANTWTHVAVTLSGDTGALYVNGALVDADTAMTINPDQLHAPAMENANYIGRGNSGGWFAGRIDEFRVYNRPLSAADITGTMIVTTGTVPAPDTTAPTPYVATWLVAPTVAGDNAITMSATEGTDAGGNGVLYYFSCVEDSTHNSGWISENKYTDCKANPGTTYTYTVKMKDRLGNTGAESSELCATAPAADTSAPTPNPPTFSYGPKGSSTSSITMTATKGVDDDETVMYKFSRVGGTQTSGWTSSCKWTDTGLTSGASYSYTLQMKDGHGNITSVTTSASAVARDETAPILDADFRMQWDTYPYTQLDKTVRMYARRQAETDVDYYYECVENPSINSGWMVRPANVSADNWTAVWVTPAMADGTYNFRFKIRDKALNETGWSAPKSAKVLTTNSWHDYALPELAGLPDNTLVRFSGKVTQVDPTSYIVSTPDNSASIKVVPRTFGYQTDATLLNQNVNVKGHLWTYTGSPKCVTSAIVAGNPQTGRIEFENCEYDDDLARPLYDAAASGCEYLGWYQGGWSVTIPNVAATTELSVAHGSGGRLSLYLNGTHYRDITLNNTTGWGATTITGLSIPAGASLRFQQDAGDSAPNLDYIVIGPAYAISGKVMDSSGNGIAGATVYFSSTPDSRSNPIFVVTTSSTGTYSKLVPAGTWYVSASAMTKAYYSSADQTVVVSNAAVPNIDFTLQSIVQEFPRSDDLLFSCVTEMLPDSGLIGSWPTYLPQGMRFAPPWGTPTVETINNEKWMKNSSGVSTPEYQSSIPCNGASIVAVVKPVRNGVSQPWPGTVSVFFDRLTFGITNADGRIMVKRNGSYDWASATIPDGQLTVMSLVAQPTGEYKLYANRQEVMNVTTTSDMTSLVPGVPGGYARTLTIGSNGPDGWSALNGFIGDVAVYKVALTDAERYALENTVATKFGVNMPRVITASAEYGGTISPAGTLLRTSGTSQTFTITPALNHVISQVVVDGENVGAVSTYTFSNIQADHTIVAKFLYTGPTYTITASAGSNGAISPSGSVVVNGGYSKTFTFTPEPGYGINKITVDGVDKPTASSYTFTNVVANHTIAVTFKPYTPTPLVSLEFENDLVNSAGGKFTCSMNAGSAAYVAGKLGTSAIGFDGSTQSAVVSSTDNDLPAKDNWTIAFWMKTTQTGPTGTQWSSGAGLVDSNIKGTTNDYGISLLGDKVAFGVGNPDTTVLSTSPVNTGEWVHVACTRSSATGEMKVYINGVMESIKTGPMGTRNAGLTINLGRTRTAILPDVEGAWYSGAMDQVNVYNFVLNASDISFLAARHIMASAGAGGTITPSGDVSVKLGSDQTFSITPDVGFAIDQVLVDGVDQGAISSYTFPSVSANHTISATFRAIPPHTIVASAGIGGSITPSGNVSVVHSTSQTFTISANTGYILSNVTVDGVSKGAITSYTFSNVIADHTISATFTAYTGPTPVAYYQFENNVLDTMGAYNGTANNSPTYVTGKIGAKAIQFNGSNQYVSISRPVTSNWTIAFWVKTTQTSLTGTQWYHGSGLVDGEVSGARNDFGISYINSKLAFGVGNTDKTIQSTSTINTGNWVHVACTRNSSNGQMKIYINGVLETTATGPTGSKGSATTLHIGRIRTGVNYFNGAIDQLRFFNTVLAASDITALANESSGYTITASAGANGSISPSGNVTVNAGANQAFTITPAAGYGVIDVKIDGTSIVPVTSYTFSDITANHTISAMFDKLYGMNNRDALNDSKVIGKLVRVWGKVKTMDGTTSFTMSDGSDETGITVMVNGASLTGVAQDVPVVVTGVLQQIGTTGTPIVYAQEIKLL